MCPVIIIGQKPIVLVNSQKIPATNSNVVV